MNSKATLGLACKSPNISIANALYYLQMSQHLSNAWMSLGVEKNVGQPAKLNVSSTCSYNAEDATSMGSRNPATSTPMKSNSNNAFAVG